MRYNLKKIVPLLLVTVVMLSAIAIQPSSVNAAEPLDIEAESAILVDNETGKIVYAKNPDMALPPASMTKIMTEYLVHEAIEEGQISWDTTTQISDYAYSISADTSSSGVGLEQNKDYTVKELYDAMAINSDNATSIALAELIAGSEGEFVKMMNAKAEEMGMTDTEFVNSTGLANSSLGDNVPEGTDPNANNLMSARSSALLAYRLINDYPEALDVTKIPSAEFEGETITNWNWMLKHGEESSSLQQFHYEGMDGLKTGHTDLAKYGFTGTAERDGNRFISVVMKAESMEARFQETAKLLDYGFNQFENQEIFPAGYQLEDKSSIPVLKGKEDSVQVATDKAFTAPVRGEQADNYGVEYQFSEDAVNEDGEITAPIEKGEKVGTAEVTYNGDDDGYGYIMPDKNPKQINLVTQSAVEKDNWFMLTLGAIGNFFTDIFSTVVDTVKGWF
ncbi:D-Ala-D-Ala carboxypeptidase A. Serine peptidase. MEROPS family S11 [Lentibacillus persicus]|uniref:serine-type D-Ala-D-Ala carboxypeptidase n=1 Tax=Lentibacillus persicus TaxID=640948 RepID=A0A1I1ULM1_9BACI|nr:serine hydrolase [Lentibacillus persicus]SFD71659.1 D-Ala-D-Ala carboxypeptidase A. Serine peptidase. MEROPS family S11 [Lentibacillus persicus]